MAVVPKKRKKGFVYYVATWWNEKQWWERSGTDKREAQRLDDRRKREVKAGTFDPLLVAPSAAPKTVKEYSEAHGLRLTNPSADDDRRNIGRYLAIDWFAAMMMDDVRPRHIIAASEYVRDKSGVGVKTAKNAYGSLRTMFRRAHLVEDISSDPCVLPKKFFKGADGEQREPYERDEATAIIGCTETPWSIRILIALCFYGGLREGEACGERWRDLDSKVGPLWALEVKEQYGGKGGTGKRDRANPKTGRSRVVPVHPELAALLNDWRERGFAELMGRPPTPDDFIVPRVSAYRPTGHHTRSTFYKAFVRACAAAKVRARSLHSTRHTMITLARRGGARKDILQLVTHNAKGDIIDRYTHIDWEPLCFAVLCVGSLVDARQSARGTLNSPQDPGSRQISERLADSRESTPELPPAPSSIPGASTNAHSVSAERSESRPVDSQSSSQSSVDRTGRESAGQKARRLLVRGGARVLWLGHKARPLDRLAYAAAAVGALAREVG